jgi:hypothetical protein
MNRPVGIDLGYSFLDRKISVAGAQARTIVPE